MRNLYEMQAQNGFRRPEDDSTALLTTRQLEVLELLCQGLQNKQIARRLNIASATVKIHVANILRALNVSSRLQAAVVAINLGVNQRCDGALTSSKPVAAAPSRPARLRLVPADDDSSVLGPRGDWSLEAAAG